MGIKRRCNQVLRIKQEITTGFNILRKNRIHMMDEYLSKDVISVNTQVASSIDLIMHINSVFMILNQIGVGPSRGFSIKGEDEVWIDFIPDDSRLELVKSYMHLKVKLIFDPPLGSAAPLTRPFSSDDIPLP